MEQKNFEYSYDKTEFFSFVNMIVILLVWILITGSLVLNWEEILPATRVICGGGENSWFILAIITWSIIIIPLIFIGWIVLIWYFIIGRFIRTGGGITFIYRPSKYWVEEVVWQTTLDSCLHGKVKIGVIQLKTGGYRFVIL